MLSLVASLKITFGSSRQPLWEKNNLWFSFNCSRAANIEDIAATISRAVGPSGPNIDYLFNLADAIRNMGQEDSHVFQLEKQVKKLRPENETKKSSIT